MPALAPSFVNLIRNTLTAHERPHGTDEVYYAEFYADVLLAITVTVLVE